MADAPGKVAKTSRTVRDLMLSHDRTKPVFLQEPGMDKAVSAILRLAMEVSVLRDRLATHELLADRSGAYTREEVESFLPDRDEDARRRAWRDDLVERLMHDLK
ncbi:MAG: hypothetical protein JJU27_06155 [Gammaproteobacteria bacterium]|nr:hypothetical protein [Gammaproteobacteria bacterium]